MLIIFLMFIKNTWLKIIDFETEYKGEYALHYMWKWKSLSHVWFFVIPWNSPGQNTGVGSLSLLQGSNPGLLHCRWILYQLSHKGSPRTLEWVACLFSRGSSRLKNRTGVSCIAGGFVTEISGKPILQNLLNKWV